MGFHSFQSFLIHSTIALKDEVNFCRFRRHHSPSRGRDRPKKHLILPEKLLARPPFLATISEPQQMTSEIFHNLTLSPGVPQGMFRFHIVLYLELIFQHKNRTWSYLNVKRNYWNYQKIYLTESNKEIWRKKNDSLSIVSDKFLVTKARIPSYNRI